ncbi:MAG TPA: helix-turn-helix transcriptional regulator [Silvibacterium sp.]|nr:helix-turn-helix transcriptional regulator [Silvibacterium sp.]
MNNAEQNKSAYAEIGFKDAEGMELKAQLVIKIAKILRERGWTQQHAAKVIGLTQPKLSQMLRGQFRGISEAKMMDCLTRLGCEVRIVVRPKKKTVPGRVKVVAA